MPAPRKFTREQLQVAALALVDDQGLSGLTMRSLAAALGTGPMTIYNYVDGREGLEQLVTEAVMAEALWDAAPSSDWGDEVLTVAEGMWRRARTPPRDPTDSHPAQPRPGDTPADRSPIAGTRA